MRIFHTAPAVWYARIYWTYALDRFRPATWGDLGDCAYRSAAHRNLGPGCQKAVHPLGRGGHSVGRRASLAGYASGRNLLDRLEVRGNLFTSLVICELIAVVTRTSKSLGLGWRNHVMALGNGWTAWAVVAILVDGLHSYFGAERYFRQSGTRAGCSSTWQSSATGSVQFWLEEPARQPISPELRAYIQALHQRIKNDLDTLGAQR